MKSCGVDEVSIIGTVVILGLSYFFITQGHGLVGIGVAYIAGQIVMGLAYWGMNGGRRR